MSYSKLAHTLRTLSDHKKMSAPAAAAGADQIPPLDTLRMQRLGTSAAAGEAAATSRPSTLRHRPTASLHSPTPTSVTPRSTASLLSVPDAFFSASSSSGAPSFYHPLVDLKGLIKFWVRAPEDPGFWNEIIRPFPVLYRASTVEYPSFDELTRSKVFREILSTSSVFTRFIESRNSSFGMTAEGVNQSCATLQSLPDDDGILSVQVLCLGNVVMTFEPLPRREFWSASYVVLAATDNPNASASSIKVWAMDFQAVGKTKKV